jgi:hypothetical protein
MDTPFIVNKLDGGAIFVSTRSIANRNGIPARMVVAIISYPSSVSKTRVAAQLKRARQTILDSRTLSLQGVNLGSFGGGSKKLESLSVQLKSSFCCFALTSASLLEIWTFTHLKGHSMLQLRTTAADYIPVKMQLRGFA